MRTFFTHASVSTFDRVSFQPTDELFKGSATAETKTHHRPLSVRVPSSGVEYSVSPRARAHPAARRRAVPPLVLAPRAMASSSRNKKRKASADPHDELRDMDRALYATFRSAANALGSLYTSSVHAQKRAFNAGARHTTRKLMEWAVAMRDGGEGSVDLNEFAAALRAELVVLEGEDYAMRDHEDLGGASTANPGAVAGVVARDGGATAGVATRGSKHHLATLEFNNLAQQVREDGAPPRSSFFLLRTNERTNESRHIDLALSLTRLPPSLPPFLPSFLPLRAGGDEREARGDARPGVHDAPAASAEPRVCGAAKAVGVRRGRRVGRRRRGNGGLTIDRARLADGRLAQRAARRR